MELNKNNIQDYLNGMISQIAINRINFSTFENYFSVLKSAIENQLVSNPLPYLVALSGASVCYLKEDDDKKHKKIIEELNVAIIFYNTMNMVKDNTIESFINEMYSKIKSGQLSFDEYFNYFETFKVLVNTNIDNVDLMGIAECLAYTNQVKVTSPEEFLKIAQYEAKLVSLKKNLAQSAPSKPSK